MLAGSDFANVRRYVPASPPALSGGVPERPIGTVSKTVVPFAGYRGFESHPLRQ